MRPIVVLQSAICGKSFVWSACHSTAGCKQKVGRADRAFPQYQIDVESHAVGVRALPEVIAWTRPSCRFLPPMVKLFRTELTPTGRPVLLHGEVERGMLDKVSAGTGGSSNWVLVLLRLCTQQAPPWVLQCRLTWSSMDTPEE